MGMHWREVKAEIEAEIDKNWFDMPIEIQACQNGIFFSGAGARGQTLGSMYYGMQDPKALGILLVEGTMNSVLTDPNFSLEQCKKVFVYTTEHKVRLLGAKSDEAHPGCDAAWLNLPNFWRFYLHIVESYDTITTKDEFRNVIWSWMNYVNNMAYWFALTFPWEFSNLLKNKITSVEQVEGMVAFAKQADAYMKA